MDGRPTILVARRGARGDVLLTTPAVRALKRDFPGSHLTYRTDPEHLELVCHNPSVDAATSAVNPQDFDRVIPLDRAYEDHPDRARTHVAELFAQRAGVRLDTTTPVFEIAPQDLAVSRSLVGRVRGTAEQPLVAFGLRSVMNPERCWFDDRWQELADRLGGLGYHILTLGAPREAGLERPHVTNLAGRGSFPQIAGAVDFCQLVISVDTVWVHVAAARGIPLLGLFGCTAPHLLLPREGCWVGLQSEISCSPCFGPCRRQRQCMLDLTVDVVYDEAVKLLEVARLKQVRRATVRVRTQAAVDG
jgi:ADP-heptose:LPS heptosyltransferase